MEIKRGNKIIADVYLLDTYVVEEVMGEHTLTLNFRTREPVDLEINDYVEFAGTTYSVRHKERMKKEMKSLGWEYTVKLYSSQYELQDVLFFRSGMPERKKNFDAHNGTALQMLNLIVQNMNRESAGWKMGSCIETETANFTFKDKNCASVLEDVVKTFETEYWIEGKTISIGKRQYSANGIYLGQGEGMGFRDLELAALEEKPPVTVLYPYGSDKNLNAHNYGHDYLLMPNGKLTLEKNVNKYGRFEESKQFDHIYPKGEFKVVEKIDNFTFISDVDFDITQYLIQDVEVILTFQDGGLAGYEVAIKREEKDNFIGWENATKKITLAKVVEENAMEVPGDINFQKGDKFILSGLKMPDKYIKDAEKRLEEAAKAWLDENCDKKVKLNAKCDDIYFKQNKIFIACGQMIQVVSEKLNLNREIRVTRVKKYLENDREPYRYELTLSDFLESNGFRDIIHDINKFPEEIESSIRPIREWSKRSWRDVMETVKMMFDPEGDYFTELIQPLVVRTAQLIVGTNSQQMDLVGVRFIPNANNNANSFQSTAGKLVHFTVHPDKTTEWTIPASTHSLNNSYAYYVYARCNKTSSAGTIHIVIEQIQLEGVTGFYHFLIGVLNTPVDGVRSWNPTYGYTEIAGQNITTGIIKSKDAKTYFDLTKGEIGGNIQFVSSSGKSKNVSDLDDYIDVTLPKDLSEIKNQVDGKIETWFQTTDPASSWTTTAVRRQHVGDLWYSTSTQLLKRYNLSGSAYSWITIEDKTAIDAYSKAAEAQGIANGKCQVFVTTPKPPYSIGDLWLDGTNLWRSKVNRIAGQSFNAGDWEIPVKYDVTKVVIDNGIVTAGTIALAHNETDSIVAGITGGQKEETSSTPAERKVRIWAGATKAGRFSAPFQVRQDGTLIAEKAEIKGKIIANDGSFRGEIIAKSGNIGAFRITNPYILFNEDDGSNTTRVQLGSTTAYGVDRTNPAIYVAQNIYKNTDIYCSVGIRASASGSSVYNRAIETTAGNIVAKNGAIYGTRLRAPSKDSNLNFGADMAQTYIVTENIIIPPRRALCVNDLGLTISSDFSLTFTLIGSRWTGTNYVTPGKATGDITIDLYNAAGSKVSNINLGMGRAYTFTIYNTSSGEYACFQHS